MRSLRLAWTAISRGVGVLIRHPRVTMVSALGLIALTGTIVLLQAIIGDSDASWALMLMLTGVIGVATVFEGATVHAALAALRGRPVRVFESIAAAGAAVRPLFGFAVIATVVSFVLMHLAGEDPQRWRFRLAAWAWIITSFLVIPIIIEQRCGTIAAFARSLALVSRGFVAIIAVELGRRVLSLGLLIAVVALLERDVLPPALVVLLVISAFSSLAALGSVLSASLYRTLR
jgi:hypothetical protein